jgi:hypothetical protein
MLEVVEDLLGQVVLQEQVEQVVEVLVVLMQ